MYKKLKSLFICNLRCFIDIDKRIFKLDTLTHFLLINYVCYKMNKLI